MKIAMVSEHASPLAALGGVDAGGQNVHVAALARALGRRGHSVEVYTRRDSPDLPERVSLGVGATVVHVPVGPPEPVPKDDLFPLMPAFGEWLLEDWLTHGRPDVIHAHFWMSGIAALAAASTWRIPVAQTFHALGTVKARHQGALDTSPIERLSREQEVAARVDLVIATCSDEVRELEAMGVSRDRVEVVPCGVDTTLFSPGGRRRAGPPRLLAVGRLVQRKGFDTVINALTELPGVELLIAGGPTPETLAQDEEACRLMALADQLGVGDRVRLVGQVAHQEMPALYRSADIVVATPWYEPFGITPLEAAACGRPVVGTAVGGLLDSVQDGVTGRLVPPRDASAVAAAIAELLCDNGLRRRFGSAARQQACGRFDWERVAAGNEKALLRMSSRFDSAQRVARKRSLKSTVAAVPRVPAPLRAPRDRFAAGVPTVPTLPAIPLVRASGVSTPAHEWLRLHTADLTQGLRFLSERSELVEAWGQCMAEVLSSGGRLLAVGNGGSAAEAQHLTAELVGRFLEDRRPFSALSLSAETSSLTAILNDYGVEEVFARQVEAHGRPGDILLALSTSGRSPNVLAAAKRAHDVGLTVWAMTGPEPNPLAGTADAVLAVPAASTAAIQEVHLVAVHAICAAMDRVLETSAEPASGSGTTPGDAEGQAQVPA